MKSLSAGINDWGRTSFMSFVSLIINSSLSTILQGKSVFGFVELLKVYFYVFFSGALLFGLLAFFAAFVFGLFPHVGLAYKDRVVRAFFICFISITSVLSAAYLYFILIR